MQQDNTLLQENSPKIGQNNLEPLLTSKPKDPSIGQVWQAAVLEYSPLLSGYKLAEEYKVGHVLLHNPKPFLNVLSQNSNIEEFDRLTPETTMGIPEQYWDRLMESKSPEDTSKIRDAIFKSMDNQRILQNGGWLGTGLTFLSANLGPGAFVPAYSALKYGKISSGFINNALQAAPSAFAAGAIDNAALSLEKETLSYQDWIKNTVIEGTIGSAFAGTVGLYKASKVNRIRADMEAKFTDVEVKTVVNEDGTFQRFEAVEGQNLSSASSNVPRVQKLLDEGIADIREDGIGAKIFDAYFKASPVVRGLRSPFVTVREWTNGMFNHNFVTGNISKGNIKSPTAESIFDGWRSKYDYLSVLNNDAYATYLRRNKEGFRFKDDILSPVEFRESVGKALRRSDYSDIPEVREMAEGWRKFLIDPVKKELIKSGRFSDDMAVKTAESYFMRVYNKPLIVQRRGQFASILEEHYRDVNNRLADIYRPIEDIKVNLSKIEDELRIASKDLKVSLKEQKRKLKEEMARLEKKIAADVKANKFSVDLLHEGKLRRLVDDATIRERAEATIDTILHENDEQLASILFNKVTGKGSPSALKERVLLIPDEKIEQFLVSDVNRVMGVYTQGLGRVIALDNYFMKFGEDAASGRSSFASRLQNEYSSLRMALEKNPESKQKSKELAKLDKEYKKAQDFIQETNDVFMGTYAQPTTRFGEITRDTSRGFQNLNAATKLGFLAITSLTDLVTPIFRFGPYAYIKDGVLPLLKDLNRLSRKEGVSRADFADAGVAIHTALNSRIQQVADANLDYQPASRVGVVMKNLAGVSGNLSLSNQITDVAEIMTAQASQARTIRTLQKFVSGQKLTQLEIERFGVLGLNYQNYGKRIIDQFNKYGQTVDGSFVANFSRWDDFEAANLFSMALRKEVTSVVTTRNLLDVPLVFRNPVGAAITQFMGWSFAATNNFIIPTLQRFDANKLQGIMAMTAMGALVTPLKQLFGGHDVNLEPEQLFREALFNSGILGWQSEVINRINTSIDLPILRSFQSEKFKRREPSDIILGPFGGTLNDIFHIAGMVASGEWNESDMKRTLNLIPYTNAFYLHWLKTQSLEAMRLPKTRAKAKARNEMENL